MNQEIWNLYLNLLNPKPKNLSVSPSKIIPKSLKNEHIRHQ